MIPKIIIVEGPDNIGKTYLCKELGGQYMHFGPPNPPTLDEGKRVFFDTFNSIAQSNTALTIMDRSPFGEFVYCKYRNYDAWEWLPIARDFINNIDLDIYFVLITATQLHSTVKPKDDEKVIYQKESAMAEISFAFQQLLNTISYWDISTLQVNSNVFATFDQRNNYIRNFLNKI